MQFNLKTLHFFFQAVAMHVNPFYLMLPVTIATSLAFMLPVATPPNAMVFAFGNMKIVDMVSTPGAKDSTEVIPHVIPNDDGML